VHAAYNQAVAEGTIDDDSSQHAAIHALDAVLALTAQNTGGADGAGGAAPMMPATQGLYLHGGVGVGKSLLMDTMFEQAAIPAKRRTHFHAFMLDVHGARVSTQNTMLHSRIGY
jgi:cell division protein ZapE